MSKKVRHFYQFGPFQIDPAERLLLRQGDVVPLAPKAVETLLALVANSGQVVEKNELIKTVWGPDTFIEEGGLARNISLLRKALGDGPEDSHYIETIPKRGYRFVAEVQEVSDEGSAAAQPPQPSRRRRWVLLAGIAAAVALAALAYFRVSRARPPGPRSLAVLPLENLSRDPAQEYFADGMTEALITNLAKIEALRVISRTSVMQYKGARRPLSQIAQALKVDHVVEGTVLQVGERVRITAQLIEAKGERHLWANAYDGDLRDILGLQAQVAAAIAREIQVKLTPQEQVRLAKSRLVNPDAYQAYLKGRDSWNRRTGQGLQQSVEHFQRAIEKDAGLAVAYSGLADAYSLLGSMPYDALAPRQARPTVIQMARTALKIDDTLAEAHVSLAYAKLCFDWDWSGAEKEFQRAIELNPGYVTAHHWYAHYFVAAGRLPEAEAEMRRALELDPLSPIIKVGLGWCSYQARRYDEAIGHYRQVLERDPEFVPARFALGLAYGQKGLLGEGIAELHKASGMSTALVALGRLQALAGKRGEAQKILQQLKTQAATRYVPALHIAVLYDALGQKEQAFEWAKKAFEERSEYLIYASVEPLLEGLRSDPRFRSLMRQHGLER